MPQLNSTIQINLLDSFIKDAIRTESADIPAITARFSTRRDVRLLHSAMGCVTESGELLGAIKKYLFYGRSVDTVNVFEEAGDILWYLAILFDELGFNFETVMAGVIYKLKARYPDKFNEQQATNRNLSQERATLETSTRSSKLEEIAEVVDKVSARYNLPATCPNCGSDNRDVRKIVISDSSRYDERECGNQWHCMPDPSTIVDQVKLD